MNHFDSQKLIELNARLEKIHQFRYPDDDLVDEEEDNTGRNIAIGAAGLGVGAVGGGYLVARGLTKRPMNYIRKLGRSAARGYKQAGGGFAGIGKGARYLGRALMRVRLSDPRKLIELNARLSQILKA